MEICSKHHFNFTESSIKTILIFLTELFESGCSFSTINTAKSALLPIVSVNGEHCWNDNPDIRRFCKGVFNIKPPTLKYANTWDADVLVQFLDFLGPLDSLSI